MLSRSTNSVVIAIAGGSASGKTTVAQALLEILGPDQAVVINQDSYYLDLSGLFDEERHEVNFDHPDALDLALFKRQVAALKDGKPVEKPVYDYGTHTRTAATETVEPRRIIIVEGLFALLDELCGLYDLKVFISTPDDLRVIRRILRDVRERGRDTESVIEQYLKTVRPMHQRLVAPTAQNADISFSWENRDIKHLNVILAGIRRLLGIMKILVIGSEGFIGGYLTRALIGEGHEVVGYDIGAADETRTGYPLVKGDLTQRDPLKAACDGVDMVINLAAKHHDFGIPREDFFLINEEGTRNILAVMSELGIKKFVFYSSVAVYGTVDGCATEETPLNPDNDYGESKLAGEQVIHKWVAADPTREVLVLRPTVIYGPHNYANMYRLIDNIHKRRFLPVGRGDNIKTVTYVENLVAANLFLLRQMGPGVITYNYSDYPHYTSAQMVDFITDAMGRRRYRLRLPLGPIVFFAQIVDLLAKWTGINFPITAKRIRKMNMTTWFGSDRIRALGFTQQVPVEEGIARMVRWYLEKKRGT